tara:strand:- start:4658 stop:5983 length:1326 start_codon:yes stop_codon:yes gene_type:complete
MRKLYQANDLDCSIFDKGKFKLPGNWRNYNEKDFKRFINMNFHPDKVGVEKALAYGLNVNDARKLLNEAHRCKAEADDMKLTPAQRSKIEADKEREKREREEKDKEQHERDERRKAEGNRRAEELLRREATRTEAERLRREEEENKEADRLLREAFAQMQKEEEEAERQAEMEIAAREKAKRMAAREKAVEKAKKVKERRELAKAEKVFQEEIREEERKRREEEERLYWTAVVRAHLEQKEEARRKAREKAEDDWRNEMFSDEKMTNLERDKWLRTHPSGWLRENKTNYWGRPRDKDTYSTSNSNMFKRPTPAKGWRENERAKKEQEWQDEMFSDRVSGGRTVGWSDRRMYAEPKTTPARSKMPSPNEYRGQVAKETREQLLRELARDERYYDERASRSKKMKLGKKPQLGTKFSKSIKKNEGINKSRNRVAKKGKKIAKS